jgi:hypothetical protein
MAAGGHLGFCPIGPNFELAKVPLTVKPHTKFETYQSIFGCCIVSRNPDRLTDRQTACHFITPLPLRGRDNKAMLLGMGQSNKDVCLGMGQGNKDRSICNMHSLLTMNFEKWCLDDLIMVTETAQ